MRQRRSCNCQENGSLPRPPSDWRGIPRHVGTACNECLGTTHHLGDREVVALGAAPGIETQRADGRAALDLVLSDFGNDEPAAAPRRT
jgi:hypothetical protein